MSEPVCEILECRAYFTAKNRGVGCGNIEVSGAKKLKFDILKLD